MKPTFFIIGAPKSGTTALSEYLRWHPRVFISVDKEPNFWNDDYTGISTVADLAEYEALFAEAPAGCLAAGEASVNYLASARAVPRILAYNPAARLVALLRNPIDLAHSWHAQMRFGLYEDEPDFEKAWRLQDARAAGRSIPKLCPDAKVLQYRDVAALGTQVERLLHQAPPDQVRLYLFDEFKSDTRAVYADVLEFLGAPDDGRTEFPVINENKTHRNPLIARFVERPPKAWTAGARLVRKALGIQRVGLLKRLREANKQATARAELDPAFRAELTDAFRPEIEKLADLLGRDLAHWLETPVDEPSAAGSERQS